jgi:hypothetical protein
MAMKRVYREGRVLNERTLHMLECAENRLGYKLHVVQGSYNAGGVAASAGTHDGGGALDVSATDHPGTVVRVLREVGFAAWHRLPSQGPWAEHIHAIAIGDGEMSSGAKQQVQEYYAGYDGLAGSGRDDGPRLHPIPVWPINFPDLSFGHVYYQFKAKNPKNGVRAVERVQRLLNKRLGGDNLRVDGQAGPATRAAWKRWEKHLGYDKADEVPGYKSLKKLAAGYFHVVPLSTK